MRSNVVPNAAALFPWLQEVFPGLRRIPMLTPLAADASTRRYWRVSWEYMEAAAPQSCILMVCDPWPAAETPDFLAVARHLRACGVHVPQVYGAMPVQGLMCLEDYGDLSLAACWHHASTPERMRWGRQAIEELVKMHTLGTQRQDAACPAFRLAFDVPKLLSELQFFRQHAIEGLWREILSDIARDDLDAACMPLCEVLAAQPRYFCHRDYHGWNIMLRNEAVGVLDFQDARMGPQPYDVVSLLIDRGTPEMLGHEVTQALIDYYLQRLEAEGHAPMPRHDFYELYDYVAVQRSLKAVGTFAYMTAVHGRQQYVPYMVPTLTYVKPLLERYELLRPLAALLRRHVSPWQG